MRKRQALGKAIKAIRLAQGRPAKTFASECKISDSHLHNIEAGRRAVPLELLFVIAHHMGVDVISYELEEAAA